MENNLNPQELLKGLVVRIDEMKDLSTEEIFDTLVSELVDAGTLNEDEAEEFVSRAIEYVRPEEREDDTEVLKCGGRVKKKTRKCKCGCKSKPKKAANGRKLCACCGGSKF